MVKAEPGSPIIIMRIHFFGRLGDRIGRSVERDVPATVATVAHLRAWLADIYPAAADELCKPSLRACIGDEIVGEDHLISGSSDIEFFPPLSGG